MFDWLNYLALLRNKCTNKFAIFRQENKKTKLWNCAMHRANIHILTELLLGLSENAIKFIKSTFSLWKFVHSPLQLIYGKNVYTSTAYMQRNILVEQSNDCIWCMHCTYTYTHSSAAICKQDVNPINFRHRINMVISFLWWIFVAGYGVSASALLLLLLCIFSHFLVHFFSFSLDPRRLHL